MAVEKKFVLRKPQTLYRITETGRQALTEYVQALKQFLGHSRQCVEPASNWPGEPQSFLCRFFEERTNARIFILKKMLQEIKIALAGYLQHHGNLLYQMVR